MTNRIRVNQQRLWDSIMAMGEIGATAGGGVGRLALTDLDRQGRDLFVSWCQDAGCHVRVDQMGNIFARRPGRDPERSPVMTGSHLDTQPLGGKFDGIYGVLAGLEAVRAMNDAGVSTQSPVDVVVWTDEEGVRFGGGAVASAVFAGLHDLQAGLDLRDQEGNRFGDELARIGYAGSEPVGGYPVAAFLEAHIEQGPILEAEGKQVGVVSGAQAQRCFEVKVEGEEGHAGTLPMDHRRDALLWAARMIDRLNRLALQRDPAPVVTVGSLTVRPNSRNTIPGACRFSIDSRYPDDAALEALACEMESACHALAAEAGLTVGFTPVSHHPSVAFDASLIELLRDQAAALGLSQRDIYSGAGHDACNLAAAVPTAMIFVPCEAGISHNERENASPEALAAGADLLLASLLALSGRA